jgi:hypothetical protein
MIKDFSICHQCQRHRWCTLSCEYLREFSNKFEMALMVYSGAWGKLIHEKNSSLKSRDTVPLNPMVGFIELGLPNWQLCAEHHQPRYMLLYLYFILLSNSPLLYSKVYFTQVCIIYCE